jgi:hypothetical protein
VRDRTNHGVQQKISEKEEVEEIRNSGLALMGISRHESIALGGQVLAPRRSMKTKGKGQLDRRKTSRMKPFKP